MIKVGIEAIGFYSAQYYLPLDTLAKAHNLPDDKYHQMTGQESMSVPPPDEDVVTLAANAAAEALEGIDLSSIDMLLFATESGIDQSKAAGIYVHQLLQLPHHCRVVELKQACYGATAAVQMAIPMIQQHPEKRILIIASDIARYDNKTPAEASQGCGAVALLISANPSIFAFEPGSGYYTEDAMDFWRPNYRREAFVDGKRSCDLYFKLLKKTWTHYVENTKRDFASHDRFCYHTPVPRLAERAHKQLVKLNGQTLSDSIIQEQLFDALHYNRQLGNSYTASLYVSLLSLLENSNDDLAGKRVGLYSYGSGCIGEYFSGVVQSNYQARCNASKRQQFIRDREAITHEVYQAFFQFKLPEDGSELLLPKHKTGSFRLAGLKNHQRLYEENHAS